MEKANLELFKMLFNKFVEDAVTSRKHYYYNINSDIGIEISEIVHIFGQMKQIIEQAKRVEN